MAKKISLIMILAVAILFSNFLCCATAAEAEGISYELPSDSVTRTKYSDTDSKSVVWDINGDGSFDMLDVIKLKRIVAGQSNANGYDCDINDDGKITALDTTYLERLLITGKENLDDIIVFGDINLDFVLDIRDFVKLKKIIATNSSADGCYPDVNGDGNATAADLVYVKRLLVFGEESYKVFTVTFKDDDGSTLRTQKVLYGCSAKAPVLPEREGYDFAGWSGSFANVTKNITVTAKYVLKDNYHTITYKNLKTAPMPDIRGYSESKGLYDLPEPVAPGYTFLGWYTASVGGNIVDYIPKGSTSDYILYAHWEIVTYKIQYFDAPQNDNVDTYTVEDEIYLNNPNWSGLGFTGWTEADNKVQTEVRNGKTYYKIEEGTTGNLKLTANWKLMRNIATPGTSKVMLSEYMEETGRYMFIYELGTIENVVIEELNSSTMGLYNHTGAGDFTLTMSTENTMEESIADSITKTISKSVSSSKEWEESKEWANEKSNEYSANASYGMEFGGDASPVKASIELGFGYTHSSGESWGGSETTGGSIGEETETGEEVGSCFSYLSSMTTTSEASVTISGDSPHGYYDYVQAGNIRVFGVVTYDTKDKNYYLNTYSILDNMHGIVLYYPDVNMLNNPTCETLEYHIPKDKIEEKMENSYFISYDANGGIGKTNSTLHTLEGGEKLTANKFTKEGYTFIGWELRDENGLGIATFTDEQIIDTALATKGKMLKLYALWSPNNYTIEYQNVKPSGSSTTISYMPNNNSCVYDQAVTLGDAPVLSGYTFGGWYADSGCTESYRLGDAGQVIEKANLTKDVNGVVKAYPKWTANKYTVTFDTDGGSCSEASRKMVFDQAYTSTGALPVPTKSDHIFLGWTLNGVDLKDTDYVRIAGNHSLKAKWMSLKWSETRGNGKNKRFRMITDRSDFWTELDEDWNPNISKKTLEDNGYTKVIITISFWVDELDQGNQRVYFATPGGKEICKWSFTSTPSSWHQYTRSTANESYRYVDISNFGDNMEFKTIWEAYGNGGDSWDLGETTVTLQFTKG